MGVLHDSVRYYNYQSESALPSFFCKIIISADGSVILIREQCSLKIQKGAVIYIIINIHYEC